MIEESIPLTEETQKELTEETKKEITIEDKNRIKNQIKEQYKNMIKLIDSIGNNEEINDKTAIVELDDLTHFDINKIYCNCCGFTSVEQNIKKTTFYVLTFTFNIVILVELTILLIFNFKNHSTNSNYNSTYSSSNDIYKVD